MTINYEPIGIINTPHKSKEGMPIQSHGAKGIKGTITIEEKFVEGLKDLDGFSHVHLIYHFHKSDKYSLITKPFLDDKWHGVFATRVPQRPNHTE
ncbi:TrmO family methyltransferase domain-containing protein [Ancylomarina sp. YFZ004]